MYKKIAYIPQKIIHFQHCIFHFQHSIFFLSFYTQIDALKFPKPIFTGKKTTFSGLERRFFQVYFFIIRLVAGFFRSKLD